MGVWYMAKSVFTRLDVIQTKALRLCLGGVKTSPGEKCHWTFDVNYYWTDLKGRGDAHPTNRVLHASWEKKKVQKISFVWI